MLSSQVSSDAFFEVFSDAGIEVFSDASLEAGPPRPYAQSPVCPFAKLLEVASPHSAAQHASMAPVSGN